MSATAEEHGKKGQISEKHERSPLCKEISKNSRISISTVSVSSHNVRRGIERLLRFMML